MKMEEICEKEIKGKYKLGELIRNDQQVIWYSVAQPTKCIYGLSVLSDWGEEGKKVVKSAFNVSQMLWNFRNNPNYLSYSLEEPIEVHRALGFTSYDEFQSPREGVKYSYDVERSIPMQLSQSHDEDGRRKIFKNLPVIYVPRIEDKIARGLLTDIIYSFGEKARDISKVFPKLNESKIEASLSGLFISGIALLHLDEEKIDSGIAMIFAPNLCTKDNLRQDSKKALGYTDDQYFEYEKKNIGLEGIQKRIDNRVENHFKLMRRFGIAPLEDLTEETLSFVKEFAPDRYERFEKAIS